ncbi:MAG: YhfC family glutamic-type intramembrane protease [Chitinophagaceae bacterium]|nr:YhfC family glutamic-type intramembrane protease [Chitinophagaceae bacterium]
MLLLSLAIAPGIAICLYIFFKDQYNKEPRRHLIVSFFLGVLSAFIALGLQLLLTPLHKALMPQNIFSIAIFAYLVVALTEEWSKYIMVRYYAFPKKEFDEPYDGIVYSVMVGMGFATIENIMYVMQHGYATAFVRMFLSVPAHGTFAVLMGYSIGKAWINYDRRIMYMMLGLFWAVFFHGTFDFFLFLREDQLVKQYVSEIMLFSGAVISFAVAVWLSRRAIKEHVILSQQIHGDNQNDNS